MGSVRPDAPLLAVKQTIPSVRFDPIRRDRLESRLSTAEGRLILVAAPAGWGKTTLLSTWLTSLDPRLDEPGSRWTKATTSRCGSGAT